MKDSLCLTGRQLRTFFPYLVLVIAGSLLLFSLAYVIADIRGVSYLRFVSDPAAISGRNPFSGVISNLGVLIWCATAAISCFCGLRCLKSGRARDGQFLLASGIITGILLVDDLFMLHELVLPHMIGFPQRAVYLTYLVIFAAYMLVFFRDILRSEFVILGAAFGLLGMSAGIDNFVHGKSEFINLAEDWFKFSGLVFWSIYFVRTSNALLDPLDPDSAAAFRLADEKAVEGAALDAH